MVNEFILSIVEGNHSGENHVRIILILLISGTIMAQNKFSLESRSFSAGKEIPKKYTRYGENSSPHLAWHYAPAGTKSFALVVDDPDAPGRKEPFVHWVVYNLPATITDLKEKITLNQKIDTSGIQGRNDFGDNGYDGPQPPDEKPHRYYFTLYALDTELNTTTPLTKKELLNALKGHILGEAKLMGTFKKP